MQSLRSRKSFEIKSKVDTHEHCELSVNGQLFMAVSEAPYDCDHNKKHVWQNMAFNVSEMGTEDVVLRAFDALREGGTVIDALGSCDWNPFCAYVIDKFGVFWWIAI